MAEVAQIVTAKIREHQQRCHAVKHAHSHLYMNCYLHTAQCKYSYVTDDASKERERKLHILHETRILMTTVPLYTAG